MTARQTAQDERNVPVVTAADFPPGRWGARWIWCEPPRLSLPPGSVLGATATGEERFACFRRTFEVGEVPDRAPARVSADSRYVLWVNLAEVSRGPIRSNGRRLHYDLFDIAPYLHEGTNCLAVLARYYGRETPWWAPMRGSMHLGAGSLVFEAQLNHTWLVSDHRWRVLAPSAWRTDGRAPGDSFAPEIFDARAMPAGWRDARFPDAEWNHAVELDANHLGFAGHHEPPSHPYGPLLPRPIPQLRGERRKPRAVRLYRARSVAQHTHPFEQVLADLGGITSGPIDPGSTESLQIPCAPDQVDLAVFDFGEVVSGGVELNLEAPPGAQIDAACFEFADPGGLPTHQGERTAVRYIARGSLDRFETFDPFGLRYLGVSIRASETLTLDSVSVNERLYPRAPGSSFRCSDSRLDRIWAVGRRTVDLTSHDAYIDCPTREQRAWTGDAVVHQMVDLATNPDWGLARWSVELGASPRSDGMLPMAVGGDVEHGDLIYIPDWALHWVRSVYNVYRYTADRDLIGRMLPVVERVLQWFTHFLASDGLLADVTGWVLVDWSAVSVAGRCSVLNGLYARALLDFGEMSEWMEDAGRAAWSRRIHRSLCQGFERFWDPVRDLYVDNISTGERGRSASQHAQAAAIVGHLAPVARHPRLVDLLTDRARHVHATWARAGGDSRVTPPGESGLSYLLHGPPKPWWNIETQLVVAQPFFRYVVHDALVLADRADLIPDQCLDWETLLARCSTSWAETWYGGTVSHGWSATPTRDLSTRTLGVTPAEPGFGRARIAPRLGSLDWAHGAVPTPAGLVTIGITRSRIEIDSPIPFVLDLGRGNVATYDSGKHAVTYA